jgi:hypothetical protein
VDKIDHRSVKLCFKTLGNIVLCEGSVVENIKQPVKSESHSYG